MALELALELVKLPIRAPDQFSTSVLQLTMPPKASVLSGNLARGGKFGTIFMAMGGWPIWEILLGNSPGMQRRWQDLSMACVHADTQLEPYLPPTPLYWHERIRMDGRGDAKHSYDACLSHALVSI